MITRKPSLSWDVDRNLKLIKIAAEYSINLRKNETKSWRLRQTHFQKYKISPDEKKTQ